ncbi:membrane protein [Microbacterium phage Damascus]|nr:membrane protein [Microbacterium phage Damascus]
MPNKLITALKENKNDIRKKIVIATAVSVGVIATAVVLSKMKDNAVDVLVVTTESAEAIADAASE